MSVEWWPDSRSIVDDSSLLTQIPPHDSDDDDDASTARQPVSHVSDKSDVGWFYPLPHTILNRSITDNNLITTYPSNNKPKQ